MRTATGRGGILMFVHHTLANLVRAYLIGHAGLAVLHHFAGHSSLAVMWSVRGEPDRPGAVD